MAKVSMTSNACIVVLKKDNPDRSVLFIDASKEFRKERAKNFLDPEHIEKIFKTYRDRKDVEKYAHLSTFDEIEKNGFNLNIPRYVDTSEEEKEVDLQETFLNWQNWSRKRRKSTRSWQSFLVSWDLTFLRRRANGDAYAYI